MNKRVFDFLFALVGLTILSPLMLVIALWIKLDSKGPIFFIQKRVGQFNKPIGVYKYRTMVVNAENKGLKITVGKDPRITQVGQILRKYKLDELPQLFNVVFGSMSFVGPRPEVDEYMRHYPEEIKKKVLSVRPGITDYASIEFKNENDLLASSDDPQQTYLNEILPIKQQYYLQYVDEQNLILDIKLIFRTIIEILK